MSYDETKQQVETRAKCRMVAAGCAVIFFISLAVWINFILHGDAPRAWRALLINFVFFTPLAVGMIVWPAVAIISNGLWARSIERSISGVLIFAPLTVLALCALKSSYPFWAVFWVEQTSPLFKMWLNPTFLFARDLVAIAIVWVLAMIFDFKARRSLPKKTAGWLCFAYAIVFTLIGFDLVMSLDPHWCSTLFGWYFFMSGMYAALAAWTLVVVFRQEAAIEQRHDLGKLIVAMSLVTTYMMYSQLLPIWYENFPHEARFVVPRLNMDWRYVSAALVATAYLGPLILLLTRWSKRTPAALAAVASLVLVGLWIERWWLVTPTLRGELTFGLIEISITVAFAAALILCLSLFGEKMPKAKEEAVNE